MSRNIFGIPLPYCPQRPDFLPSVIFVAYLLDHLWIIRLKRTFT